MSVALGCRKWTRHLQKVEEKMRFFLTDPFVRRFDVVSGQEYPNVNIATANSQVHWPSESPVCMHMLPWRSQ